jgi:PAS domain S-box-containing protein
MLQSVVVAYVGDDRHGLDIMAVLDEQLQRPVNVLTVTEGSIESLLHDGRIDGIVCGQSLDGSAFQSVVNELSNHERTVPLFDLTGSIAAVPDDVSIYYVSLDADTETMAQELVGHILDAEMGDADGEDEAEANEESTSRFPGAYFAVDADWVVTDWDPKLTRWTDESPSAVVRSDLFDVFPSWDGTALVEMCSAAMDTDDAVTEQVYHEPTERQFDLHAVPLEAGGMECYLRDINEYIPDDDLETARFENTLDRITDAFFALDNEDRFIFLNSKAETILDVDEDAVTGVRFWDAFPAAMSTSFYEEFNDAMHSQNPTSFEEYYKPSDSWLEVNAYPSTDGLSVILKDITEQIHLQHKLEQLHDITRDLIVAESDTDIASETIHAGEDILEFPKIVIWRFDRTTEQLKPLDWSDTIWDSEVQSHGPESEFIWDVYEEGDHHKLGFVPATTSTSHHPGKVTSEMLVPIGDYGVMGAYSDDRDAFDETDVELFRILASTVESAFARTRRERQLARRNERLNDFASIVSHDLRNPLSVASMNVELAREKDKSEKYLDKIESSLYRMEELIEDLLSRARGDQELDRESLSLTDAARSAWEGVDTGDATLMLDGDAQFNADPDRLKQLFENLYRNAVEHGGDDITIRVGPDADGFYVADDGVGIPPDEKEEIFEQGVTHSEEGTGYGLAIVADIAEGHGWSVEATDSQDGGARFEIGNIFTLTNVTEA